MKNAVPPDSRQPSDDEILRTIPATRRVRELRVGLFVILGLSGFFIVLFTMTNPGTFRGRYTVLTRVEDAGGMRSGDAVTMRGVHIGRVRGFDLTGQDGVLLTLEVDRGWQIPVGSRTEVHSTGFLGGMQVSVVTGPGPGFVEPGTLLPGTNVEGALDVAAGVADEATDVLARMREVLSDSTVANTEAVVRSLREMLDGAADMTGGWAAQIDATLDEFRQTAENLEGVTGSEEWQEILASAQATTASLNRTSDTLAESAASLGVILGRIERGEGTLGRLTTDDELYDTLNAAAESLRELLDDIRENPDRYVTIRIL